MLFARSISLNLQASLSRIALSISACRYSFFDLEKSRWVDYRVARKDLQRIGKFRVVEDCVSARMDFSLDLLLFR